MAKCVYPDLVCLLFSRLLQGLAMTLHILTIRCAVIAGGNILVAYLGSS